MKDFISKAAIIMVANGTTDRASKSAFKLQSVSYSMDEKIYYQFMDNIVEITELCENLKRAVLDLPKITEEDVELALNGIAKLEDSIILVESEIDPYYKAVMN